ncbi:MAG: radical SAM protein [Candidatus Woesearchaeota archaeon]
MKRKVIIVYPKTGKYDQLLTEMPLSVLCAATLIYQDYDVRIIDQRVEPEWKKKLLNELKDNPICVALSSMTGHQIKYALDVSKLIKENSKVPVVWGGIHASLLPKQTIENQYIDMILIKEGEVTFKELVKALEDNKPLEEVEGIWFKKNGKIIENKERKRVDLNELPMLPYHLIDFSKYKRKGFENRIISVITSRGCPQQCTFCYACAFYKRMWKPKSAEKVIEEIKYLIKTYNSDELFFVDDNFFVDFDREKKILKAVHEAAPNLKISLRGLRVDEISRMDDEFLRLLEKCGIKNLHIGAESGSERILKIMKKDIRADMTIKVNRKLRDYDLYPVYNFMLGIPTETEEDIYATTRLLEKLLKENPKAISIFFGIFTPYPGTEMYEMAIENGFKPPQKLEDWANFDFEGWLKINPWITKKRRRLLEVLVLTSFFIDKKVGQHMVSNDPLIRFVRFASRFYRPIAKLRFKHHISIFPIELTFQKWFFKFYNKGN